MVLVPLARAHEKREARRFHEAFTIFKAYAVSRYHPVVQSDATLRAMSLRELRDRFDIHTTYRTMR